MTEQVWVTPSGDLLVIKIILESGETYIRADGKISLAGCQFLGEL